MQNTSVCSVFSAYALLNLTSAEGVSNGAMLGVLFILFNVAEKDFGFRKLYLLSDIRNLK